MRNDCLYHAVDGTSFGLVHAGIISQNPISSLTTDGAQEHCFSLASQTYNKFVIDSFAACETKYNYWLYIQIIGTNWHTYDVYIDVICRLATIMPNSACGSVHFLLCVSRMWFLENDVCIRDNPVVGNRV